MSRRGVFAAMLAVLTLTHTSFSLGFGDYLDNLYRRNRTDFMRVMHPSIKEICSDVKGCNTSVSDRITELLFLHSLFTTTDAVDGQTGGILEIPYFWHWVDPNPRHEITCPSGAGMLNKLPPPAGYKKYKSYADIDRTPYIYLKNLLEEVPRFHHPSCGTFYTFGWCSEREMAFSCILKLRGFRSKIKQEGIHVWTEVLLDEKYGVVVDNTFDRFRVIKIRTGVDSWQKDYGDGAQVMWYNRKAHSETETAKVRNIEVPEKTERRIQEQIIRWMGEKVR